MIQKHPFLPPAFSLLSSELSLKSSKTKQFANTLLVGLLSLQGIGGLWTFLELESISLLKADPAERKAETQEFEAHLELYRRHEPLRQ